MICGNKIVVLAQNSVNEDELATISCSLSKCATEHSMKDARFDFLAACSSQVR